MPVVNKMKACYLEAVHVVKSITKFNWISKHSTDFLFIYFILNVNITLLLLYGVISGK